MAHWTETSVECYAGYRGDEIPRYIRLGHGRVAVTKILSQWIEPACRCFRVTAQDQLTYTLRQDVPSGRWEIAPDAESGP